MFVFSCDTYWQSDGQLPHLVNVQVSSFQDNCSVQFHLQFRRKTTVSEVAIYTDYKLDESYTPTRRAKNPHTLSPYQKTSIRYGTSLIRFVTSLSDINTMPPSDMLSLYQICEHH